MQRDIRCLLRLLQFQSKPLHTTPNQILYITLIHAVRYMYFLKNTQNVQLCYLDRSELTLLTIQVEHLPYLSITAD
jgi:hypothetical protein